MVGSVLLSRNLAPGGFGKCGNYGVSLAQEYYEASLIWGQAAIDQSRFPLLATLLWLGNGGFAPMQGKWLGYDKTVLNLHSLRTGNKPNPML